MDRAELIKRRDELRERLTAIRRDLSGGLARDLEDQAQQLENQDTLMEIARISEEELEKVEIQLQQLEEPDSR